MQSLNPDQYCQHITEQDEQTNRQNILYNFKIFKTLWIYIKDNFENHFDSTYQQNARLHDENQGKLKLRIVILWEGQLSSPMNK